MTRALWTGVVVVFAATLFLAGIFIAKPHAASGAGGSTASVPVVAIYHGVNQTLLRECISSGNNCMETVPGLARCMQIHRRCNDFQGLTGAQSLTTPVRPGTVLLTQRQALRSAGAYGTRVKGATATPTTYGQLHKIDPALAASTLVNAARPVWLVTIYFVQPIQVQSYGPVGAPPVWATEEQLVVDAATGQTTDMGFLGGP